jgi:ketosteroid isomerase-like protein
MRLARVLALSLLFVVPAVAQKSTSAEDASVRAVLTKQVDDWNRGDLDTFAAGYKNSPDILFIGATVRRGYQGMIASYRKNYPNKAAMGVLTFSNLEVHPLDARFATVLGNFHLERTAAGGGNADGYYSLVMEKTSAGWKIVLDHTTAAAPQTAAVH